MSIHMQLPPDDDPVPAIIEPYRQSDLVDGDFLIVPRNEPLPLPPLVVPRRGGNSGEAITLRPVEFMPEHEASLRQEALRAPSYSLYSDEHGNMAINATELLADDPHSWFTVELFPESGDKAVIVVLPHEELETTITDLNPGTRYDVFVEINHTMPVVVERATSRGIQEVEVRSGNNVETFAAIEGTFVDERGLRIYTLEEYIEARYADNEIFYPDEGAASSEQPKEAGTQKGRGLRRILGVLGIR